MIYIYVFIYILPSGIIPAETNKATTTLCQKEKKMIAFTQRNFGNGLK